MVRRRFSIAGLLAVGVMMIAADASQAQLLQRLRDRMGRGSSDEGSSRRFSLRRSYYRGEQAVVENGVPITNGTPISSSPISSSQVALDIRPTIFTQRCAKIVRTDMQVQSVRAIDLPLRSFQRRK